MENFCHLNKFVYSFNAQNKNFIIQLCVAVELFSLKDACGNCIILRHGGIR